MIHLVASDIDGTLITEGTSQLDPIYFTLIEQLAARGIRFAAASGRAYTNLRRLFAPVADQMDFICENGNLVVCQGEILQRAVIERGYGESLLQSLYETDGCEPLLSGVYVNYIRPKSPRFTFFLREQIKNDVTIVDSFAHVPEEYLKIAAYFEAGVTPAMQEYWKPITGHYMRPVISGFRWLDFLLEGYDKGTGLAALQQAHGIAKEETMAFGDNENDRELLAQAGIGCAMATGSTGLQSIATRIVNNVAQELQKLL